MSKLVLGGRIFVLLRGAWGCDGAGARQVREDLKAALDYADRFRESGQEDDGILDGMHAHLANTACALLKLPYTQPYQLIAVLQTMAEIKDYAWNVDGEQQ